MMEDLINKLAADIFEVDDATIKATDFLFDLEKWDSLTHVVFIEALETNFGIKFNPASIFDLTAKRDIIDEINKINAATQPA